MSTGWILITRAVAGIDDFTDKIGRFISWCNLALVLSVCLVVVLRYLFDSGSIALQEFGMYLHALVFLGASSFTLKQDGHVRVDVFYSRMSTKNKALVNCFGTLFLLMPVCLFISAMGWDYVAQSWAIQETSVEAGGLPVVYLLKSLILVFAGCMLLQGIAELFRALMIICGVTTQQEEIRHG